jgi:ubiquinone/menaquinone biosynthesis C-methylase UbiE
LVKLYLQYKIGMIQLRPEISFQQNRDISVYLNETIITESDRKEFTQNVKYEERVAQQSSGLSLFEDVVSKSNFIKTFELIMPELDLFPGATVLEMGACHAWASVMVKVKNPSCYVVTSDLVSEMLEHSTKWENLLGNQLDEKWAFNCRDIPFADEQFDRIFTFASFHHFGDRGDYRPVLIEMIRSLKKGGKIILLYEPSSPKYLYKWAFDRVNNSRENTGEYVDEDVLVIPQLEQIVRELGCTIKTNLFPLHLYRDGFLSGNYYYILSKLGSLQKLLVSTVNLVIIK